MWISHNRHESCFAGIQVAAAPWLGCLGTLPLGIETDCQKFETMGLLDIFKGARKSASGEVQPPRRHHYSFAYQALPGLVFNDPYVALGFAQDEPEGALVKFWAQVGATFPEPEQVSDEGLAATAGRLGNDRALVLVSLPKPMRETEAYFVGIVYPQSWLDDPSAFHESRPSISYFVLAKSQIPGKGGKCGGALRYLNQSGHGLVDAGVPVAVSAFLDAIRIAMTNRSGPETACITWVNTRAGGYVVEDPKTLEVHGAI